MSPGDYESFPPNPGDGFSFGVRFGRGMTTQLRQIFEKAAARWLKVIDGALPPVVVDGDEVRGLRIDASAVGIDQRYGFDAVTELEQDFLRPPDDPKTAFLPAKARIKLDTKDLAAITEADAPTATKEQYLLDLVTHEMGHALGFSMNVWVPKRLLNLNETTDTPVFTGSFAKDVYGNLGGESAEAGVPLEATGTENLNISHWSQVRFTAEIMTPCLEFGGNFIGPVTIAALRDMGYTVSEDGQETDLLAPNASLVHFGPPPSPVDEGALPRSIRVRCHLGIIDT